MQFYVDHRQLLQNHCPWLQDGHDKNLFILLKECAEI